MAPVLAIGDVHRPVDQHGEAQPRAGAEFQYPHAALAPVGEFHQPHAGEL